DVLDSNRGPVRPTVRPTINGVNDAPGVSAAVTASATEDDAAFSVDLLEHASDPDSSDTLHVSGLTWVSGDATGITPAGDSLDVDPAAYNYLAAVAHPAI